MESNTEKLPTLFNGTYLEISQSTLQEQAQTRFASYPTTTANMCATLQNSDQTLTRETKSAIPITVKCVV